MSRVFVIADLHLGHRKLQEIRGVSDDEIVRRWNSVVTKRDVVYVLGDVFRLDRLPELLGLKKLALGNHDKYPAVNYLKHFTQVRAMYEYDGCILTHIPVHLNQKRRYRLNVHGHSHTAKVMQPIAYPNKEPFGEVEWDQIVDPWYRCVSVEQINYTPVLLNEIIR